MNPTIDRASRIENTMSRLSAAMATTGASRRIVLGTSTDRDDQLMILQKRLRRALVKAEAEGLGSYTTLPE